MQSKRLFVGGVLAGEVWNVPTGVTVHCAPDNCRDIKHDILSDDPLHGADDTVTVQRYTLCKLRGNVDVLVSAGNKLNDDNKKLREHIKELESFVSSGVRVDFDSSQPRVRISELEEENARLKAELLASGLARVYQVAQSGAHLSAMVSKVAEHSRRAKTIEQEKNELVAILKELTDVLQKAWDERRLPADIISGELARKCRNTLENYGG